MGTGNIRTLEHGSIGVWEHERISCDLAKFFLYDIIISYFS